MKKSLVLLALPAAAAILAGCSTPPATQLQEIIIEHEKTLDRVHNRDDSMEFYKESRGGAALRKEEASHVLYNEHYVADAEDLDAKHIAELQASWEKQQAEKAAAKAEAERKAKEDALKAQKKKADELAAKRNNARDKSIYGKDKSIYAKDKSIYR